jgi:RHS repeat-associated protein
VAVLAESVVYNIIHTDQLNTPRLLTAAVDGTVAWSWDPEPFGNAQPTGTLTYNHRFPGQYYDRETGLHHNGFRDYHPTTGRYIESDPLGLRAGLNTYAYVNANPLSFIDPFGLEADEGANVCVAIGQRVVCSRGMRPPPEGIPLNGPLSPYGYGGAAVEAAATFCPVGKVAQAVGRAARATRWAAPASKGTQSIT